MGQVARQAAEELLQSSRTDLAPLEALEKTRGEFKRRVESNLSRLPGFDPAAEVKRRKLEEATEQLTRALDLFEEDESALPPDQQSLLHVDPPTKGWWEDEIETRLELATGHAHRVCGD